MTTFIYSENIPNPPDDPADDVYPMQINSQSIDGIIAVDHVGFNTANGGEHLQVTFESNNVPATPSSIGTLFTNIVTGSTVPELFYYSGTAAQSANQYVQTANGSTFAMAGIILKWGSAPFAGNVPGAKTIDFPVAFPNNCFAVFLQSQNSTNANSTYSLVVNAVSTANFTINNSASFIAASNLYYLAIGN